MIYSNEESIYVTCDCGNEGIHINKLVDKNEYGDEIIDYILSFSINAFYSEQDGFFHKFKNRLKVIWYILRYGTHRFFEIIIDPKDFEKLKDLLIKYK